MVLGTRFPVRADDSFNCRGPIIAKELLGPIRKVFGLMVMLLLRRQGGSKVSFSKDRAPQLLLGRALPGRSAGALVTFLAGILSIAVPVGGGIGALKSQSPGGIRNLVRFRFDSFCVGPALTLVTGRTRRLAQNGGRR